MNENILRTIFRSGAVIISTLLSLAVHPPPLHPGENNSVYWKSVFVFFAGVLGLLFFDKIKSRLSSKSLAGVLLVVLITSFATYEIAFNRYSLVCPNAEQRVVASTNPVKPEFQENLKFFEQLYPKEGLIYLVDANHCTPLIIWNERDIYPPYFGLIFLYLLIIIVFMLLLMVLYDLVRPVPDEPSKNKSHEKNNPTITSTG